MSSREVVDLTAGSDSEEVVVLEPDFIDDICYGRYSTQIVGIQYYEGSVNLFEMVLLEREPDNPYDHWAIRVDNVYGVKVGHIGRQDAAAFSPLIDAGHIRLEGEVSEVSKGRFKMPVDLYVFGAPEDEAAVVTDLGESGIYLEDPTLPPMPSPSRPSPSRRRRVSVTMTSPGFLPQGSPPSSSGGSRRGGNVAEAVGAVRMSQHEVEDSLDKLFSQMLAGSVDGERRLMRAPAEVATPLYPHQEEALAWMVAKENSAQLPPFWEPFQGPGSSGSGRAYVHSLTNFVSELRPPPLRGGCLCDDMGLGKTLTVLALIATNRPGAELPPVRVEPAQTSSAAAADSAGKPNGGADGPPPAKRRKKEEKGGAAAAATPARAAGKQTGAANSAGAAAAGESPPEAGGPRGTLIVCPLSVMSNWASQVEEHTRGDLTVYLYHGKDRDTRPSFLAEHDIVITTYNTLASDLDARGGLLKVPWLRVCLDEGHTVKNAKTRMAKAAAALQCSRRWVITGTPIQNSLADLYGLMHFLRLDPLAERCLFVRTLERPIKSGDPIGLMRLQALMSAIALRRTKDSTIGGKRLVELPENVVNMVPVTLSDADRAVYSRWETHGRSIVRERMADGTLLQNYTTVLEIILRLRQICDDTSLCQKEPSSSAADGGAAADLAVRAWQLARLQELLEEGGLGECAVCLNEPMAAPCITACLHAFCRACIEAVIARDKAACPLCRTPLSQAALVDPPPPDAAKDEQEDVHVAPGAVQSAKVAKLVEVVQAARAQGASEGGREIKSVVFSQWTGMLNLVQAALAADGHAVLRIDGSTSAKRRAQVLRDFASLEPGTPAVLLVSLKAGGVGLNLTSASHVHLLEPFWNPATEDQAQDRIHRLGQTRAVSVFRYIAKDTIEERMLELQEHKRQLLSAAFAKRSAEELRAMRIAHVKLLLHV